MFSRTADIQIQRVPFFRAVSDAIIGKNFPPGGPIDADISAFYPAGRVFDIENGSDMIAGDLHLTHRTNYWRSVVDVNGFANSIP